jgi:hypothetical protein
VSADSLGLHTVTAVLRTMVAEHWLYSLLKKLQSWHMPAGHNGTARCCHFKYC